MPFKLSVKGLQGGSGLERVLELTKFGEGPPNFVDLDCTTMSGPPSIVVRVISDGRVQVWKHELEALGFRLEVL